MQLDPSIDPKDPYALYNEANRLLGIKHRIRREEKIRTIYDSGAEEYGRKNRWQEAARNSHERPQNW